MLERALIAYGSPTLARLKVGSLFAVPVGDEARLMEEVREINQIIHPRGVTLTVLCRGGNRMLMYLYREEALCETLGRPDVQAFLMALGYQSLAVEEALRILRQRLSEDSFPHEVGVFLGYPLPDVVGFMRHGGRECLCSGCWKVYANEHEARRAFARLRKCREVYARRFAEGYPLSRLTVATAHSSVSSVKESSVALPGPR